MNEHLSRRAFLKGSLATGGGLAVANWGDLFRSPVEWGNIDRGLLTFALYTALFLGIAVLLFRRKDITS